MIPSPPICINIIMITFPKVVKVYCVSTTESPVTQTALVEVNSASRNEIFSVVAFGSCKQKAPRKIIPKKLIINN